MWNTTIIWWTRWKKRKALLSSLLAQEKNLFWYWNYRTEYIFGWVGRMSFSECTRRILHLVPEDAAQAQAIVDEFKPVSRMRELLRLHKKLKYDLAILKRYGVEFKGRIVWYDDRAFFSLGEMRHSMDVRRRTWITRACLLKCWSGKKEK